MTTYYITIQFIRTFAGKEKVMKNILNSIKNTATGLVESVKSHFVHEVSAPVVEEVVEEVAKKNGLKAAVNTAKAVVTARR